MQPEERTALSGQQRRRIITAGALALWGASFGQTLYAQDVKQDITTFETARLRAELDHQMPALEKMLADDLWYVHATGKVEGKADHLKSVAGDGGFLLDAILSERSVQVEGNVAITHGLVDYKIKTSPTPRRARYLAVYIQRNGHWQLLAWQNLPVHDAN